MLFQCCLGPQCFGVPFGRVIHDGRIMSTFSDHIDWGRYTSPLPEGAKNEDQKHSKSTVATCIAVLTLFPAFPELDRVPAQNRGGKKVADTNTVSAIGVGVHAQGMDCYCLSINEQKALRKLVTHETGFRFTTDVHLLQTYEMHMRTLKSQKDDAVAAAARGESM